jgi:hypothetical protein
MCLKALGFRAKVTFPHPERDIHEADEGGHFDQGPDYANEGFPLVQAKDGHSHRNSQLEVVPGGGEREGGRLRVVRTQPLAHPKADQKHDQEVDDQRMPVRAIQKQARWSPLYAVLLEHWPAFAVPSVIRRKPCVASTIFCK